MAEPVVTTNMAATFSTELSRLSSKCREAASFYAEKPGLVSALTVIDIYETLSCIADHVDAIARRGIS